MSKFNRLTFVLAVVGGIGGPVAALAQSSPPGPSAPPPGVPDASGPGQGAAAGPQQIPVLAITSIEVQRSTPSPAADEVRVRGVTGTKGWSNAELIPITHGTPSDGILDLVLVATPSEGNEASGFGQLEATLPVRPGHPYKGVRVRGASNAVTVKAMPGSTQAKAPGDDCSKCIGKVFVAKGATPPAGVAAADIVKQDDLPGNLRIVRPTDGIGDTQSNPNRLTLVIGEDGKIVDAAWD
jgi:hypothetical protein